MNSRTQPVAALALLATLGATPAARSAQADDPRALAGEWLYVEDRTEGRAVEDQQPPMSTRFALRVEEEAVVLVRGEGARQREERIPLDGSTLEVADASMMRLYRGEWRDGALEYESESYRLSDDERVSVIRWEFQRVPEGLLVRVVVGEPARLDSLALYEHPEGIPLPTPARATIDELGWLAGAWVGRRGEGSIEERWSPPLGGAMLGVARTVSGGAMVGFEYLRVVERDGGLVYVAQPGGAPPTDFVLTELSPTRAVFDNPRHDSPQRLVYELSDEDSLTASIGFIKGGRPQLFQFTREGS